LVVPLYKSFFYFDVYLNIGIKAYKN
jgi:hypothetical protein